MGCANCRASSSRPKRPCAREASSAWKVAFTRPACCGSQSDKSVTCRRPASWPCRPRWPRNSTRLPALSTVASCTSQALTPEAVGKVKPVPLMSRFRLKGGNGRAAKDGVAPSCANTRCAGSRCSPLARRRQRGCCGSRALAVSFLLTGPSFGHCASAASDTWPLPGSAHSPVKVALRAVCTSPASVRLPQFASCTRALRNCHCVANPLAPTCTCKSPRPAEARVVAPMLPANCSSTLPGLVPLATLPRSAARSWPGAPSPQGFRSSALAV